MAKNELDGRPGIRRVDMDAPVNTFKPMGQQSLESHVVVPAFIGVIVALVCTGMAAGIMMRWFVVDVFGLMLVFCISFLVVFMKRIGVGDKLLWAIEAFLEADIDGNGDIGYAPRDIPVNRKGGADQVYVNMPPVESKLTRAAWEQVAVAALTKNANISRRGLRSASKLSQSEASLAAKILHDRGRAKDGKLNGAGWDWLIVHLPETVVCAVERPPTETPLPQNNMVGSG